MGAIMFQGTGSDVGKSVIVAGICRAIANRGLRVRPFKAQNMSNNAAVTHDGGEIGRAQATQAFACRTEPSIDMNPVLLKPQTDQTAQLVVHGKIRGILGTHNFREGRSALLDDVMASYQRLQKQCDIVVVEGAGSPAEINLRDGDIANMGFARAANVPVILLGDINRGGVIASIVGTRAVIDPHDAALIQGFVINKFRGDLSLFEDGYRDIERLSKWRGLGVIPWLQDCAFLPSEDAVVLEKRKAGATQRQLVACPITPRISNFDDLDPLRLEPGLELMMVPPGRPIPQEASLIVLAGSKATVSDLNAIRREGWDIDILAHHRNGGMILGLCGGYQMLGKRIMDPYGIEGCPSEVNGLGLLNIETTLTENKTLEKVSGTSLGARCEGYEMHIGSTSGPDTARPLVQLDNGRIDGAISADGLVSGTYLHGLFTDSEQRAAWLARLGLPSSFKNYSSTIDEALNNIAMEIEQNVNMNDLIDIARSFDNP